MNFLTCEKTAVYSFFLLFPSYFNFSILSSPIFIFSSISLIFNVPNPNVLNPVPITTYRFLLLIVTSFIFFYFFILFYLKSFIFFFSFCSPQVISDIINIKRPKRLIITIKDIFLPILSYIFLTFTIYPKIFYSFLHQILHKLFE